MKKTITTWNIFSMLTLLALIVAAFGVVFPVQAQAGTPVAPTQPAGGSAGGSVGATVVVPSSGTEVVPDTGAPSSGGFLFSGWALLVILAVVVIVLLIALLARGSSNPPME